MKEENKAVDGPRLLDYILMMTWGLGLGKTYTLHHLGLIQLLLQHIGLELLLLHLYLLFLLGLLVLDFLPIPLLVRGQLLHNLGGAGMVWI